MAPAQRNTVRFALGAAIVAVIGVTIAFRAPAPNPPRPVVSAYYVWQMQWNDEVRDAVRTADASAHSFMILAGEVDSRGGELRVRRGSPDWSALAPLHAPITIVLRANASLAECLRDDSSRARAIEFVGSALDTVVAEARSNGAFIGGVQLDYDCPSARLAMYSVLVRALRVRFDDVKVSITALPTWLGSRDFAGLVDALDYYVLQVHSLERPTAFDQPVLLCDTAQIPNYLKQASAAGKPFYLALPTYGYRFVFDEHNEFKAIIAEGPAPSLNPGLRIRTAMTNPDNIAKIVRAIRERPPRSLIGFAWFRLPVASDALNWPWQTLEAVRDGRDPQTALAAELRSPGAGLYELYITNSGETWPTGHIHASLHYPPDSVVASDTLNDFIVERSRPGSATLTGPAPRPGQSTLAAWYRMAQQSGVRAPIHIDPIVVRDGM